MHPQEPTAVPAESHRRPIDLLALLVVFGLTVGLPLASTLTTPQARRVDFGQQTLLALLVTEGGFVALLWPWLARRGWHFGRLAGAPEPRDVARGLGLALLAYVVYSLCALSWAFVAGGVESFKALEPTGSAAPWLVVTVALLNPLYEEFLWLAFGFTALEPLGPKTAIVLSTLLRTAVHTYQGTFALVSIVPIGLVFSAYFARTRRLWPVIVAHLLFDSVALLRVSQ